MNLTKQQRAGLDKLKAAQPFAVKPGTAVIVTGVNTTVLHYLRERGLISCSNIWLRGHVSADLTITEQGRAL
jgi:hypothetical protein